MTRCCSQENTASRPVVGVMGGSFDPPHNGHVACARAAQAALGLDGVVVVPTCSSAYADKTEAASAQHRLTMCRIAASQAGPGWWESDVDIVRGGTTYTFDTMCDLRARYPEVGRWVFIAGSDALAALPGWYRVCELAALMEVAVVHRAGCPPDEEAIERVRRLGLRVHAVSAEVPDISSTQVRREVAAGREVSALVPGGVAEYIRDKGLYRRMEEADGQTR